ncbi:nucleotide sugar dehydrogenase [Verrucomicrobiota bacterium]
MSMGSVSRVSVFGLGKLGATMVGCFADAGFDVVGVDVNADSVNQVTAGTAPVPEPGLQEIYDRNGERISATTDGHKAVLESQASFIIVPTPSTRDGEFFTSIAVKVADTIGSALREKQDYHLVVLTSTVLPGATERDIKPVLEEASSRACGRDFGLCYSPEFIAIGDVIRGLVSPDFFLVGEYDERSGDILSDIYRAEGGQDVEIARMAIVNAELTKIAVNTFVTSKISFANTLSRICGRLPGGDAHAVAAAVGLDKRIGGKYLTPGATFGGPCFPRDNRAFEWFARSVGEDAPLARATDEVNRRQIDFLVATILSVADDPATIGILGLSYKPRTNLMEEAQGAAIARRLLGRGFNVVAYDPWVDRFGMTEKVDGLDLVESIGECVGRSDIVVLATAHDEFTELSVEDFTVEGRGVPLVDTWGLLRDRFVDREGYTVPGIARGDEEGC